MSDEFCSFVPDDPSCQEEPKPSPPDDGKEIRDGPGDGDKMEDKEAKGMEA